LSLKCTPDIEIAELRDWIAKVKDCPDDFREIYDNYKKKKRKESDVPSYLYEHPYT
jgi:hypothetical protein